MRDALRRSFRALWRTPSFSVVAVATLALGIGATVAVFSAVHAVLLAPLPYPDANALVVPVSTNVARGIRFGSVPYADFLDWRAERDIFAHVAVWWPRGVDVAGGDGAVPERIDAAEVDGEFFDVLGVQPLVGRRFRSEDHAANAPPVAIISHGLWQRALGGAPDVLDRDIRIGGTPTRVVGVLQPASMWPEDWQLWLPLHSSVLNEADRSRRDNMIFQAIARLQPGASLAAGRARVAAIAARVARDHPESRAGWSSDLVPMRDYFVERELRDALLVLLGAVGLVMLIACVNVASLLLARATVRARELALRAALGAGPARIARELLVESLLLAAAGGTLGLAIGSGLMRVLAALAPAGVPFVGAMALNGPVLAAALALSLGSVLVFGVAPAMAGARQQPVDALRSETAAAGTARATLRLRDGLVVVETALAVILMVSAGLMTRSLFAIVNRDPGVEVDRVLAARVALPGARYDEEAKARFFESLTADLARQPGVAAAAATSFLPAGGGGFGLGRVFLEEGQPEPPSSADYPAFWNVVTPDYFRTLGIPLRTGRAFTERDSAAGTPVIVINETLARKMFPNENPLGRRIRSWRDENVLREIVGVVADVRYGGLADEDRALVYVPHRQNSWGAMAIVVRTTGNPADSARLLRETVARLDPDLALGRLGTLAEFARASVARERFSAALLAGFAGASVLLASIGIYGVMAYLVARRSREFGIRAALGASPRELFGQVIGRGLALTAIGGALGVAGAMAASRALAHLLFEAKGIDTPMLAAICVLLPAIAIAACAIPAVRASRSDPIVALRAE